LFSKALFFALNPAIWAVVLARQVGLPTREMKILCAGTLLARFANLAYCFERLLASNGEGQATPPSKALTKLYKQRNLKFPEQLIVELIPVMGTYPLGSLITLSTGKVGLVLEQNRQEKLSPKIAVLTDACKALLDDPDVVDLANQRKSKVDRFIVSSYRSQNSSKRLGDGGDLDPRNYSLNFFGKRVGIGSFSVRF
jgi:hypothetical protein